MRASICSCQVAQEKINHDEFTVSEKRKNYMIKVGSLFGLCGRRRGWDVSREQHRNMYII